MCCLMIVSSLRQQIRFQMIYLMNSDYPSKLPMMISFSSSFNITNHYVFIERCVGDIKLGKKITFFSINCLWYELYFIVHKQYTL